MDNSVITFWQNVEENVVRIVFNYDSWEEVMGVDINLDLDLDSLSLQVENETKTIVLDLIAKESMDGYRKMETIGCDLSIIRHAKEIVDKYVVNNPENCKVRKLKMLIEDLIA